MTPTLLGKSELSVSPLGFGAAPIGFLGTPQGQTNKLVVMLFDEGVNLFDTAAMSSTPRKSSASHWKASATPPYSSASAARRIRGCPANGRRVDHRLD